MSIFYRKYQNKNEKSKTFNQWYGRTVTMGKTVELEDLAEHMAQHNTPYSEGVIKGVLTDMVNCIRELVLEGKSVKIPNLCIFSAGIKTRGADRAQDFSAAQQRGERLPEGPQHGTLLARGGDQESQHPRTARVHHRQRGES